MIGSLRNFAKTKFAGLLVVLMIIPFVFWGMGSMFSSGNTNNIAKINNTNISKTTINNSLKYSSVDYFSNLGFKSDFGLYFMNLNTTGKNHSVYKSSLQSQLMSIFEVRSEFPLIKQSEKFNENFKFTLLFSKVVKSLSIAKL